MRQEKNLKETEIIELEKLRKVYEKKLKIRDDYDSRFVFARAYSDYNDYSDYSDSN